MKKLLHKNFFTLVEVLIAMGICVVGLCSVVVFFPIGATASRNASMASYAANVAVQILDFAKVCIESDTGAEQNVDGTNLSYIAFRYFTSPTALVRDPAANLWQGWDPDRPWLYTSTKPSEDELHNPEMPYSDDDLDELMGNIMRSANQDGNENDPTVDPDISITPYSKGMTRYLMNMLKTPDNDPSYSKVTSEIIPYRNNVFYARFVTRDVNNTSDNDDEESVYSDFDCYVRLWATPIEYKEPDPTTGRAYNIPYAMRLHVLVSWPADLPYESRQKREYSMDVFKQY